MLTVQPATETERPLIERLVQFYTYDFSEMEPPGSTRFELNERGAFETPLDLAAYFAREDRQALLIRQENRPAGFALLDRTSHLGGTVDRNMGEFFILRKYRRQGLGGKAVRAILTRFPGRWEVAVVTRNAPAQTFWPRAIAATPGISDLTRREGDGKLWRGPVWRFVSAGT